MGISTPHSSNANGIPPIDETQIYVRNGVRYLRLLRR